MIFEDSVKKKKKIGDFMPYNCKNTLLAIQ